MHYSPTIQQAISFATRAHAGQTRKGKDIPYITHPLTVALILSRAGASEEVIIAGLLHDVVEDCDVELTEIKEKFGDNVATLVEAVTEQDKSLPWDERKRLALDHIADMNHDALLLKSADVLHNLTDLLQDVAEHGDAAFDKYNAPKDKKLDQQQNLVKALEAAWPDNPLLPEIKVGVESLVSRKGTKCKCDTALCGKCLGINCQDKRCSVHTAKLKKEWRERWERQNKKTFPHPKNY